MVDEIKLSPGRQQDELNDLAAVSNLMSLQWIDARDETIELDLVFD